VEQIAVDNPICPACYSDTAEIPLEGIKYYQCTFCKHSFADLSSEKKKKIIKRFIFKNTDRDTGLFDPLYLFNGNKDIIKMATSEMIGKNKVIVSNCNYKTKKYTLNRFDINPEDDAFKRILDSHMEIKCDSLLSVCFIPFCDDVYNFITSCYKQIPKNGKLIFLTNNINNFLHNNIGQTHHFTAQSLHYILSSQQKNYKVFSIKNILGFKMYGT